MTYTCCRTIGQTIGARCIGRGTYLSAGNPISCQLPNTCPGGFECSAYSSTGQYICCNVARDASQPAVCPDNAEPYHDSKTKEFHYCSNTGYACPDGYLCKKRLNSPQAPDQYICCSTKPMCQRGWLPYFDASRQAKSCSPYDNNQACSPTPGAPYVCQQSTVPSKYLCCMESLISMENDGKTNKTVKPSSPFDDFGFQNSATLTTTSSTTTRPHEVEDFEYVWGDDGTVHSSSDKK